MKLNLCCGEIHLKDYVNVDTESAVHPDLLLDVRKDQLPYADKSISEIRIFHGLEHIERKFWDFLLVDCGRVLEDNGLLILGYPEFSVCAQNFINNKDGGQKFWVQTLFGRQNYAGDYHVTAMHSPELRMILESYGFYRINVSPESSTDYYYSIMAARKDPSPQCREEILAQQIGLGQGKSIEAL